MSQKETFINFYAVQVNKEKFSCPNNMNTSTNSEIRKEGFFDSFKSNQS